MANRKLKKKIKNLLDFETVKELTISMDNEFDVYKREEWLTKNYSRKMKKGKFDLMKAKKGVDNLIVTPYVRKYQNEWGVKVGRSERDAISKNRIRNIIRRIRENEY